MKILVILIASIFIVSCASTAKNAKTYTQPDINVPSVTFIGEESEGTFFGKGHEKIYLCRVDGAFQNSYTFNKPTRVALGSRAISICYNEGANFAEAPMRATFDKARSYQIKLGEHSWTEVNFTIIDSDTGKTAFGPVSVPKQAGDLPILIFTQ